MENSVSSKDVWALSDSWTNEPKWNEGRIEINGDELADDTKYKVRPDFDKKNCDMKAKLELFDI